MTDTADRADAAHPADAVAAEWEDPPRVDRADTAPILAVDGFAGPLDWWLDLARAKDRSFENLDRGADRGVCHRAGDRVGQADGGPA
jgi:hypothetical protein